MDEQTREKILSAPVRYLTAADILMARRAIDRALKNRRNDRVLLSRDAELLSEQRDRGIKGH